MIHAFVLISVVPDHITDVATATADIPGVRSAHSVTGAEADVVAVLGVRTHDEVAEVVTERISKLEGVLDTTTMIAFRTYSSEELDAAYEGFDG